MFSVTVTLFEVRRPIINRALPSRGSETAVIDGEGFLSYACSLPLLLASPLVLLLLLLHSLVGIQTQLQASNID